MDVGRYLGTLGGRGEVPGDTGWPWGGTQGHGVAAGRCLGHTWGHWVDVGRYLGTWGGRRELRPETIFADSMASLSSETSFAFARVLRRRPSSANQESQAFLNACSMPNFHHTRTLR